MTETILYLICGFGLLVYGADFFIKGAVAIANKLNLAPILIGLTIVSFGTSAPEFVVSLSSSFKGANGLILGNVIGSNIANTLLILGAAAAVCPLVMPKGFKKDLWWLIIANVLLLAGVIWGQFSLGLGAVMVAMLGLFMYKSYKSSKANNNQDDADDDTLSPWASKPWLYVIFGTAVSLWAIIFGADLLVDSAVVIAKSLGVSDEIIGLTVIAIGTSLPELATSCAAARKGQSDMAIGNVVGSNIWNILFILGATACINPVDVPSQIGVWDVSVLFMATAMMLYFISSNKRVSKGEGLTLLLFYGLYIGAIVVKTSVNF